MDMSMLYDSDNFVLVRLDAAPGQTGFEFVDKRTNTYVYLFGRLAACVTDHILAWQANTPTQDEVENVFEGYAAIAHQPLLMH